MKKTWPEKEISKAMICHAGFGGTDPRSGEYYCFLETLAGGSTDSEVLVRLGAKVNPLIAQGEYWRLFTSMFLHGSIFHLGFNMLYLWIFGNNVEDYFGPVKFVIFYVAAGLAAVGHL